MSTEQIKIGTSGFSYEDWIGPVYPKGIKKEDMLAHYANELGFNIVELNHTYYTMPTVKDMEGMLRSVPNDFEFVVKANRAMTHDIRERDGAYIRDEAAIETFLAGLQPMVEKESLKCVLAQFPLKFKRDDGAIEQLKWLSGKIRPVRLAVEFRGIGWLAQSVFDLLKQLDVSYCVADTPDIESLAPFTPVTTAQLSYLRFHGRNKNWFNVPSHVRHDYLYSEFELRQFIGPIRKISSVSEETVLFFNNHFKGSAVTNALRLNEMLAAQQDVEVEQTPDG